MTLSCAHRFVTFTVVSDPIEGDTNAECVEFGTAEFDLRQVWCASFGMGGWHIILQILNRGRDINKEKLEG